MKRWGIKMIYFFLLLVFVIIGVKIFDNFFDEDRWHFCQHDDDIGWVGRPYANGKIGKIFSRFQVKNNSWGFRNLAEPQPGEAILVLGDSVAWGYGVEDDQTLSAKLTTTTGGQVISLAQSGYGTDQQYLAFEKFAPCLLQSGVKIAQVVMVTCATNDTAENLCSVTYGFPKPFLSITGSGFENRPVPDPDKKFNKNKFECLNVHGQEKIVLATRQYSKITALLKSKVTEMGARLLIVVAPCQKTNDSILGTLNSSGIESVFDPRLGEKNFLVDQIHWNQKGNELAAAEIAARIRYW